MMIFFKNDNKSKKILKILLSVLMDPTPRIPRVKEVSIRLSSARLNKETIIYTCKQVQFARGDLIICHIAY